MMMKTDDELAWDLLDLIFNGKEMYVDVEDDRVVLDGSVYGITEELLSVIRRRLVPEAVESA